MTKASELRDKSVDELNAELIELRRTLYEMVNSIKINKKTENPNELKENKKQVARLLTVIREKELAEAKGEGK